MNTHAPLDAEAATLCHRLVGTAFPWDGTRALLPSTLEQLLALSHRVETSLFATAARSRLVNGWQRPTPSDGARFQLDQLGPPALLERLNRPRWSGQQRRIGLTGGIASGKSSVGQLLAAKGLPVLDADLYAREALAPGSPGALAVLARYGQAVRAGSGGASGGAEEQPNSIDRAALGRIVFTDGAERQWLERLVHPLVRERFAAELERLAEAPVVVLMVPLLFEAELDALCSEVWLVDCDDHQQLARLMARDRLNEAEARARLAAQWPLARKRPLADQVLDNRGTLEELEEQVARALSPSAWR
jgi:dephospho-CoA kinase